MRIFFILLLILAICYILFRSWKDSEKPNIIILVLVTVPLLFLSWGEFKWQSNEALGTEIVLKVSENPEGSLKCQRFSEALLDASVATLGFVYFDEPNVATVKYNTCQDLFGWFDSSRQQASLTEIQAVGVLIHEAVHVSGEFNEATTECLAMKTMPAIWESLGVDADKAVEWTSIYKEQIHVRLPSQYLNGTC